MPTIRRRKQFNAEIQSVQGKRVSDCYAIVDVETTVVDGARAVSWAGKITSLSDPQHSLQGPYLLQAAGAATAAKIQVFSGAADRMGITSDEYQFRGEGDPPEVS